MKIGSSPRLSRRAVLTLAIAAGLPALPLAVGLTVFLTSRSGNTPAAAEAGEWVSADLRSSGAGGSPNGHELSAGSLLAADTAESVTKGPRCPGAAPVRGYDVVAVRVDITVNRYLAHDPQGRMYVLADQLQRVRDEEAQNARARAGQGEPAVSLGLHGDAIQPLALRVDQGECLRVRLTNGMETEPASLHLHGSGLHMADTGAPAVASNPKATALPGQSVTYEWMVGGDEPEGTHYFHSHGDEREQTGHGLFGAVIVEPKGSMFLDPSSGREMRSGWSAVIRTPDGKAFREFALFYHEVGNESYQLLDRAGGLVPQVDPITTAYRPDARALNYRSEPFMDRLNLQASQGIAVDESAAYSSYAFGDPATPLMRSYVGDPVKERVIHGGSEVFHVHHVHGGSIRWRRQPGTEPSGFDQGLNKHPALLPAASERIDSQGIGPSETFDVENECGSGGCQESVGDFLYHCHIAQHYFAGMWGLWRVYNTLQDGVASTDALPPLMELPGRAGAAKPAVTSQGLIGATVDWSGKRFSIDRDGLAAWVERQLPPPGIPRGYDASVLDWQKLGTLYFGEAEAAGPWPGYRPKAPGQRPALLFDPTTGKLAYPFLLPHLGKRPPFAPNHGPAPYLDPTANGDDLPAPGANGPASLCPIGTKPRQFTLSAVNVPITINQKANIVDPAGELFVLSEQAAAVRADNSLRTPLAIRANAGEDCVDILFKSELQDGPDDRSFSKVNAHIHFVQFDVQASDGVVAGFNYEQSVRPYAAAGETVQAPAAAGETSVRLSKTDRFQPGVVVGVGMDRDQTFETARVKAVQGDTLVFDRPLRHPHGAGAIVSTEFVRYRWYPDVQSGTAYLHDHVNALSSWRHGLYGALIVEPPGSTYHDPVTGAEVKSGLVCDIRTAAPISVDVTGSFRELVVFVQDDSPLTHVGRSSGGLLNLRAEPLDSRKGDPADLFSSARYGDPETPVLRAYVGDPVVVRSLVGGTNDTHTIHVDGHWFRAEQYSKTSPPVNTVHLGISERYDLVIPRAGGPQSLPGDYLFYNGRTFQLREGNWGLLRVLSPAEGGPVKRLPGHEGAAQAPIPVCPPGAPEKRFSVVAVDPPLPMLGGAKGKLYVLQKDKAATLARSRPSEPLVLHVSVGDCIKVELSNETADGAVSFHPDLLAFDPKDSGGVAAGFDSLQAAAPGAARAYTFFAHPEIGETAALIRDWGNVTRNPGLGLYGAIVVGPAGAVYRDPQTGADMSTGAGWQADVYPPSGKPYRDFALFFQDEDDTIGTHRMPYTTVVQGTVGVNYRAEPLGDRKARNADTAALFRSAVHGDPATPLLRAYVGDPVKIHVLAPWSEQAQVFSIEGHRWPVEPGRPGTSMVSSVQVGGLEAVTIDLDGGAGGSDALAGDYVYGDHRMPYTEAGLWGILRVLPQGSSPAPGLLTFTCGRDACSGSSSAAIAGIVGGGAAVAAAGIAGLLVARRRRAAQRRQ